MRELIQQLLGIIGLPQELEFLIWAIVLFGAASVVGQVAVVFMVLMERKVLAWITQRKGPNRVGPYGALQTLADGIKLLFKEIVLTPDQDRFLYTMGPVLFLFPVFIVYLLVPFTSMMTGINLTVSLLFYFAISSLSVLGIVLSGWASNNKYSLLGGMRSAAQAISYEIPLIMAAMSVALAAGSVNLMDIVNAQNTSQGIFSWNFLALLPVGFGIFYIASIAEVNRIPFDLPEAESELVSGYNTEYSGMNFAMFFLAEYAALFGMSALTAILFFGGYYSPFGGLVLQKFLHIQDPLLLQLEMATWLILKTYAFITFAMLLRGTLPRLKPDELMGFSWKFLMPLSLVNLLVVAMLKYSWTQQVVKWVFPIKGLINLNAYYLVSYALCALLILVVFSLFGAIFYTGAHKRQKQINKSLSA